MLAFNSGFRLHVLALALWWLEVGAFGDTLNANWKIRPGSLSAMRSPRLVFSQASY